MAITIDWGVRIIHVPRDDLTLIQSTPTEIRELNLNWFRMELKSLEDSEEGMCFPDTHRHNTEVTVGGLTLARVIEIINDYTVTFEDGQYAVNLVGANSNVGDKTNVNQVSVRSQNSAGMTSSPAIEYASYNGGVTVDITSSYIGTLYPIGTPIQPVNNLEDALLIADFRGFKIFYIIGDLVIDSVADFSNKVFKGESRSKSSIFISDNANVYRAEFYDCFITGILDGEAVVDDCRIGNLYYVNGIIQNCGLLSGTILLGGNEPARLTSCWNAIASNNLESMPTIDMGDSGQELIVRNYSGDLKLINKTGSEDVSLSIDSGTIVLDDTVINGNITVSGIGVLIDNSIEDAVVNSDSLVSAKEMYTLFNILLDVEQGNWEIVDNQMIFYKIDGNELMKFNLLDSDDNPTETTVYKRIRA